MATLPDTYLIGPYNFTRPIPLDEAKPPIDAGVYILFVMASEGGRPAIRYVGQSSNLKSRVNYGHDKIQELMNLAKRDPSRLYAAWHLESRADRRSFIETALIARYRDQVINVCKNTPTWRESHRG